MSFGGATNPFEYSANAMGAAAEGFSPGTIKSGMGIYKNPYQKHVIDNTTREMRNAASRANMFLGAEADAAGAFGGSRHGIAQGQLASDMANNIGDMTANLSMQGWDNAANLAGRDIQNQMTGAQGLAGLAGQGFDMGRTLNQDQYNMGLAAQNQQQEIMNAAQAMFSGMTPSGYLGQMQSNLSGSPLMGNSTGIQTNTPGLGQSIGAGLGVGSRLFGK